MYTVGGLADHLGVDELKLRHTCMMAGVHVGIFKKNPEQEMTRKDVIELASYCCGTYEGNLIADYLTEKWNDENDQ